MYMPPFHYTALKKKLIGLFFSPKPLGHVHYVKGQIRKLVRVD